MGRGEGGFFFGVWGGGGGRFFRRVGRGGGGGGAFFRRVGREGSFFQRVERGAKVTPSFHLH